MKPSRETEIDAERTFSAPWEARSFAIALKLSESGICTWDEFRLHLIAEIAKGEKVAAHGWIEDAPGYYVHFLRALENLLREKGIIDPDVLKSRMEQITAEADHHHD